MVNTVSIGDYKKVQVHNNKTYHFSDAQQKFNGSIDDGRSSSHSHLHNQQRRSPGNSLKRPRYILDGSGGSRLSVKSLEEDEESLRMLLTE